METREDLIKLVLEALKVSKKMQLFENERVEDVKYDESKAVILEEGTYWGLSIGDRCSLPKSWKSEYLIAAFIKMTAKIRSVREVKRENVFCVLAIPSSSEGGPPLSYPHRRIIRVGPFLDTPIRLFPLRKLKKVE